MEPIKKRRKPQIQYFERNVILQLVIPYIFPGNYESVVECFRTFLALAGTCTTFRYWNILRRWIGYLCPPKLRARMILHSFEPSLNVDQLETFQEKCYNLCIEHGLMIRSTPVTFSSYWVTNNFFANVADDKTMSQMDFSVGEVPFYNVCRADPHDNSDIICFYAASFSELALAAHAICSSPARENTRGYLLIPAWKTDKYNSIYIENDEREVVLQKSLLGRLRRIGLTAPQELGFHHGQLPYTAYSWFCKHCDTNKNRRNLTPADRLYDFISTWFVMEWKPSTKSALDSVPYNFLLQIE